MALAVAVEPGSKHHQQRYIILAAVAERVISAWCPPVMVLSGQPLSVEQARLASFELNGRLDMWALITNGDTLTWGNLPTHNMVPLLTAEYPDATIFRSVEICHNEFGALAFAKEWVQTGEQTIEREDGTTTTQPIYELRSVGNTHALEGDELVVRDKMGDVIGTFAMEVSHEPVGRGEGLPV